jgi:hypothetical protein
MAQVRERGIYKFATPPRPLGVLTARYRLLWERGDWESIRRTILPMPTLNYEPYIPCLDTDLSPEAMITCGLTMEPTPDNIEEWMMQGVDGVTSRTMRLFERVYDSLGEDYVLTHFCPVAWSTASNPSEKELKEKTASIIASSGRTGVPLYNVAVSDKSMRQYGVSMPVVWMRRAFLRTFKAGNDMLNIYRMMGERITEKYDIPAFREEE